VPIVYGPGDVAREDHQLRVVIIDDVRTGRSTREAAQGADEEPLHRPAAGAEGPPTEVFA
jgi:hypothetical protein